MGKNPRSEPKKDGWKCKKNVGVDIADFKQHENKSSLSDVVKGFTDTDMLEEWKDKHGHFHCMTAATLTQKEIEAGKRYDLTFNQFVSIAPIKTAYSAWKKLEPASRKKICGFHAPACVLDELEKVKKPRAPAKKKESSSDAVAAGVQSDEEAKPAKTPSKPRSKPASNTDEPEVALKKHTQSVLSSMDVDNASVDTGKLISFTPAEMPTCPVTDSDVPYLSHQQVISLMGMMEDPDQQSPEMIKKLETWCKTYRASEVGGTKKTLKDWIKTSDPDFKNLLVGFGIFLLKTYKRVVIEPFITSSNKSNEDLVELYKQLQATIKGNKSLLNEFKAAKELLANDLQASLLQTRILENKLADKDNEIASLFKQMEELKKKDDVDIKAELRKAAQEPGQTVISSSGKFRKRDELSPVPVPASMDVDTPKAKAKPSTLSLDSDDDIVPPKKKEHKTTPKRTAKESFGDDSDDDLLLAPRKKPSDPISLSEQSMNRIKSVAQSMKFDSDNDSGDDDAAAFSKKPAASSSAASAPILPKKNSIAFFNGDDSD